ncbi:TetR/AcrR family transcriptional regulator [Paenibacillus oleatilyticus]|uniref:TetR/AcrR family transcriptional regulator n=1 Tax=Paenibacillus oleatilyticus TaxID=2594886 RepID=UPI001C20046A|nr:TetR family transcriptional regulator [Paenibacillus oleatilyticus]MBU7317848.1 TetR family transcriptional regulator [Paenibacillus oleatilyticus]
MEKSSDVLTKEQIIAATEETIRRYGMAKTSVTDVAKALDVSHGSIYRHFKSKTELFEAATEQWLEEKIVAPLADVCRDSSLHGVGHVQAYIQTLVRLKRHYAREDEALFAMYAKVSDESAELISKHIGRIVGHLMDIMLRGGLKSDHPERSARAVFYATARFHHPAHAYEWKSAAIDAEFSDVWALIEQGLKTND